MAEQKIFICQSSIDERGVGWFEKCYQRRRIFESIDTQMSPVLPVSCSARHVFNVVEKRLAMLHKRYNSKSNEKIKCGTCLV